MELMTFGQRSDPIALALIEGLSGRSANAGDAVARNLLWAVERVNTRGGVRPPGGARDLLLLRFDSKGAVEEAVGQLRAATDQRLGFILQGNSSAVAAALIDALNKHNEREPTRRALFLNCSAVDPALTNERCSPWHFRFDARTLGGRHESTMRAADHQVQQPLVVSIMNRAGTPVVAHDVEGTGFGFRTLRRVDAAQTVRAQSCKMVRPR